jgi:hypothetical protein
VNRKIGEKYHRKIERSGRSITGRSRDRGGVSQGDREIGEEYHREIGEIGE